ncbi:carbohydrate ABC transporter, partial [Streptomyces chartreusis]|uniref:carbohydrate ABC transporter n=1 Tax=Streptomyces chartreusis TaxID=1969 RepID=UPI0016784EA4
MSAGRPLTKSERKKLNRAEHERKIRQDLIAQHGRDLGTFYYWLRIMNIRGTQAYRDGDTQFIRDVALALENVY